MISRLKSLQGPSREVDAEIYNALVDDGGRIAFRVANWATPPGDRLDRYHDGWLVGKSETDRYADDLPHYTASLDATVALVEKALPGWSWECRASGTGDKGQATVWNPMKAPGRNDEQRAYNCPNPSIALLIALFTALEPHT